MSDRVLVIVTEQPRCKLCRSFRLKITRTYPRRPDGSIHRRVLCLDCGAKHKHVAK